MTSEVRRFMSTKIRGLLEDGREWDAETIWIEIGGDETDDVTQADVEAKLAEMIHNGVVVRNGDSYALAE